jgi:DNA modification methylase
MTPPPGPEFSDSFPNPEAGRTRLSPAHTPARPGVAASPGVTTASEDPAVRDLPPVHRIPTHQITERPDNPRNITDTAVTHVARSLQRFGWKQPLVIDRDNHLVVGHTRHRAARTLGLPFVPAVIADDLTPGEIDAYRIVDNRSHEFSTWDLPELARQLDGLSADFGDVLVLADWDAVLADLEQTTAEWLPALPVDPDEAPPLPAVPVTRPGDVWHLGGHRLLCGDATSRDDVARLLDGDRCDVMVTDPPYGVAYRDPRRRENAISGDLTQAVIPISFAVAVEQALTDDARIYLFGGSGNWTMYAKLFEHHTRREVKPIVWDKGQFVLRPNGYHSQFEMVYFGWKGAGGANHLWFGDRKISDVWQVNRRLDDDRLHLTQKPVEVCAIPIRYSCPPDGLVYEPFAGSGSTLIAATLEGRTCRALEVDPAYCDVVCRRFQALTGILPIRDGEPVDFTAPA